MESFMSLTYESSLSRLCELNESFDAGVLRIAYHGANRNGSFISKQAFERSIETIWNCPVVCNYDRDSDTIGSHDIEVITDKEGNLRIVNITQPVGVVPESATTYWETIEEEDGTTHEYLCVDVLLWKRQEAYRKIVEGGITKQSMEITVKEGSMKDGLFYIDKFAFTAFCLLGSARPCYESASLELFSCNDFKHQFSEMIAEMKNSISNVQSAQQVDIQTNYSEGGEFALEEKNALMAEFNIDPESIDFDLNELSVEELREKFEAMTASVPSTEKPEDIPADPAEKFALAEQVREELVEALHIEEITTDWGTRHRYCFVDYDFEAMEVYFYDVTDWKLYGMQYEMNGDSVKIDFDSKKRKKHAIVDFNEGDSDPTSAVFAQVVETVSQKYAEINTQLTDAAELVSRVESDIASLQEFKANAETELTSYRLKEIRDKFADLAGVDEFESLCEKMSEYSLSDFEEKCFAIRGRNTTTAKFSLETTGTKLPVMGHKGDDFSKEPYNGLFIKYGKSAN